MQRSKFTTSILVSAALLGLSLSACSRDDASAEDEAAVESPAAAEESAEATGAEVPTENTAPRTASAADVQIATDIVYRLVSDRLVDARHISVTVIDGVAELSASDEATEEQTTRAAELAQTVDGVRDVRVGGEAAPHVVSARDELAEDALAAANGELVEGASGAEAAEAAGTPQGEPQDDNSAEAEEVEAEPAEPAPSSGGSGATTEYTIRSGDSLSIIAERELGSGGRWTEVYEMNRSVIGPNPDGIRVGMRIRLPAR